MWRIEKKVVDYLFCTFAHQYYWYKRCFKPVVFKKVFKTLVYCKVT